MSEVLKTLFIIVGYYFLYKILEKKVMRWKNES